MKTLADLSQSDVERILGIVDRLNDIEVRLEIDGMKLHVRKFSNASTATARINGANGDAAPSVLQAPDGAAIFPEERDASVAPHQQSPSVRGAAAEVPQPGLLEIRAPMLGRFFRAPSPTEPAFVELGARVEPDDTVCTIEVMKLFNTVRAEVTGTIVEVLVENGAMVEHDAVLFRVRPE